jgi:Protein of unknown function (DUF3396)
MISLENDYSFTASSLALTLRTEEPEDWLDRVAILGNKDRYVTGRIGLSLELYFETALSRERNLALLSILQEYSAFIGSDLKYYVKQNEDQRGVIKQGTFPDPIVQSAQNDPVDDGFDVLMYGYVNGYDNNTRGPFSIEVYQREKLREARLSYLYAHFPIRDKDDRINHARVEKFLVSWSGLVRARCGLAGFAIIPEHISGQDDRYLFPFLKRFPGLDYANASSFSSKVHDKPRGVKTVNWLNYIDDEFEAKLGGREAIKRNLGAKAVIIETPSGIVLKAGEKPLLGDANEGVFPDGYQALAESLRPILFTEYEGGLFRTPEPMDDLDETHKWLKRFDREGEK